VGERVTRGCFAAELSWIGLNRVVVGRGGEARTELLLQYGVCMYRILGLEYLYGTVFSRG
jgi:hypothetical protein